MYFLEYTVQKEDENEPRHFLSAVSLGFNGRYGLLCSADVWGPLLQAMVMKLE